MFLKIKQFFKDNEKDLILITGVILISLISFSAGRLSAPGIPKYPISFEKIPLEASILRQAQDNISNISSNLGDNQGGVGESENKIQNPKSKIQNNNEKCFLVGSKNSDKYHYPWCIGAKNISEKNKICFSSIEEAQSRGYQPAGNCSGL